MSQVPIAVLYPPSIYDSRKRITAATTAELTTEQIQERHMKHIAEITKHLATEPIQSEELNYEQKQWLYFRMGRPFPKPYRPHKPIVIPYKWIEDTKA